MSNINTYPTHDTLAAIKLAIEISQIEGRVVPITESRIMTIAENICRSGNIAWEKDR